MSDNKKNDPLMNFLLGKNPGLFGPAKREEFLMRLHFNKAFDQERFLIFVMKQVWPEEIETSGSDVTIRTKDRVAKDRIHNYAIFNPDIQILEERRIS